MINKKFFDCRMLAKQNEQNVIGCCYTKNKGDFNRWLKILNGNLITLFNEPLDINSGKKVRDIKRK